jgi:uncharacterized RDD family membrane protein YckC
MPLVACPDCGRDISDAAPACPFCGRPAYLQRPFAPAPPAYGPPPQAYTPPSAAMLECPQCRGAAPAELGACPRCAERLVPPASLPPHYFRNVPVRYAGFWPRFGASLVDCIVVFVVLGFAFFLQAQTLGAAVLSHVLLLSTHLYYIVPVALTGRTLGKSVAGIRILRADGSPAGWEAAFMRDLPTLLAGGLLVVASLMGIAEISSSGTPYVGSWVEKTQMVNAAAPGFRMPVFWLSQLYFLVDVIVFFVNSRRRALHDLIAGTVVVHD